MASPTAAGLVNGVYKGFGYALRVDEKVLADYAILALGVEFLAAVAISFLAGYVSRRMISGVVAGGLGAGLILAMPARFSELGSPPLARQVTAALVLALAFPATLFGERCPIEENDLAKGRVIGVAWWHWLWLWLPWQYMIANAIWLATPRFLILGTGGWSLGDVLRSVIAAGIVAVGAFKALDSLREEAQLTRTQALLRFLAWFLLVPVLANLWRMIT